MKSMAVTKKKLTPSIIKKTLAPVLKEYGVKRAYLFGSHSRGDATLKSDVDLLVYFPRPFSFFDLFDVQEKLKRSIRRKVDIITPGNLTPRLQRYIKDDLKRIV